MKGTAIANVAEKEGISKEPFLLLSKILQLQSSQVLENTL
jgi:hypothetical protein